jgi:hypothetical protein
MDSPSYDGIPKSADNVHREMQLAKEDKSDLEVPEVGVDSSLRVTKSPEPIELAGALANYKTLADQTQCPVPGEPMESVDNVDDAGIDSTREPDWEVVEPSQLPPEPQPSQFHNDRYWEERSLDRELQDKDLQDEMIQRKTEDFDRAAEAAEDFSRSNSNEVLDPYYQSGSDSSNPPSGGNSLDSFV